MKYPLVLEMGTGTALRSGSYTKAACRAVRDALWKNAIYIADVFDVDKSKMQVSVEIACQNPDQVDLDAVVGEFPYGTVDAKAVQGGLDIARPSEGDGPPTLMAHAAIRVGLDLVGKEANA